MEIRDIYIFICLYSFFYGTFTRSSMNNLDSATNTAHFMLAGVALTNATVVLHAYREQIKEKAGMGERSQTE